MRAKDDPVIMGPAKCAGVRDDSGPFAYRGCPVTATEWCGGCNLVFCGPHHEKKAHNCRWLFEEAAREQARINAKLAQDELPKTKPPKKGRKPMLSKKAVLNGGVLDRIRAGIARIERKPKGDRSITEAADLSTLQGLLKDAEKLTFRESKGEKLSLEEVNNVHRLAKQLLS